MPAHPHAALMAEYAKDAMETKEPWKRWEVYSTDMGNWYTLDTNPNWIDYIKYRRKAPTIMIGDMEVPEPCKVAPNMGNAYYLPITNSLDMSLRCFWANDAYDHAVLNHRMLHLNKEAAIKHAKALIKISGGYI